MPVLHKIKMPHENSDHVEAKCALAVHADQLSGKESRFELLASKIWRTAAIQRGGDG